MYARIFDRRRLTLPLLFPCVGGLYYLWVYDAPLRLMGINANAVTRRTGFLVPQ